MRVHFSIYYMYVNVVIFFGSPTYAELSYIRDFFARARAHLIRK